MNDGGKDVLSYNKDAKMTTIVMPRGPKNRYCHFVSISIKRSQKCIDAYTCTHLDSDAKANPTVSNSTVLVIVRNAPGVWPLLSAESLLGADTPSKYLEITQL